LWIPQIPGFLSRETLVPLRPGPDGNHMNDI
jgi:hypothetical protein